MFRLQAVHKDGKMLSRVAAWEHSEDQKQLRTIAERSGNQYDEQVSKQRWAIKMANLQKEFPNEALEEQPLAQGHFRGGHRVVRRNRRARKSRRQMPFVGMRRKLIGGMRGTDRRTRRQND